MVSSEERALQGGCYSRPFNFPRPIKGPKRGRMPDGGSVPIGRGLLARSPDQALPDVQRRLALPTDRGRRGLIISA
jgi:hypothetical protein